MPVLHGEAGHMSTEAATLAAKRRNTFASILLIAKYLYYCGNINGQINDIFAKQTKKVAFLQKSPFLAQILWGREKSRKKMSGQEKVKIIPYLSVFGRNLPKRTYSILTKFSGRRPFKLWHSQDSVIWVCFFNQFFHSSLLGNFYSKQIKQFTIPCSISVSILVRALVYMISFMGNSFSI